MERKGYLYLIKSSSVKYVSLDACSIIVFFCVCLIVLYENGFFY